MCSNFLSHQLSLLNNKLGQMEPSSDGLNSSISNIEMGMVGPMSNGSVSQPLPISDHQMGMAGPVSNVSGVQRLPLSNQQMGQMGVGPNMSQQFLMADQRVGPMEAMWNLGSQKLMLPSKRKVGSESIPSDPVRTRLLIPDKRASEMDPILNSPGLQQRSAPTKKTVQLHSMSSTPGLQPASSKKMVRNESVSGRSVSQQTPRSRTAPTVPSPKVHTESFESVRSKMRESLAAALALVSDNQDKTANEEKNSQGEVAINPQQKKESSVESAANIDDQRTPQEASNREKNVNFVEVENFDGQEFFNNPAFRDEDAIFSDNFFVKDDLLQGNGLSWALDHDMEVAEPKEVQTTKKAKLVHDNANGDRVEQAVRTPENLAFKIEAELFKLFGGVNKKYKEKGRSLLFNLKDRNNPELRENVMSGKISPERLCSMTAEELASKELSEWRTAKAEELAQMVVLPDSDVDIRRLVRKTHKGEFQVEVELDDSDSVDVYAGTSILTRTPSKKKEMEAQTASKSDGNKGKEDVQGEKGSLGNQDLSSSLAFPSDGSDLMQGLMVDEFKDAEFLPPIVSLDEFMESLDSEPPFENLPVEAGKSIKSEASNDLVASDPPSKDSMNMSPDKIDKKEKAEKIDSGDMKPVKAYKKEKAEKFEVKHTKLDAKVKSSLSPVAPPRTSPPGRKTEAERVWEGLLQLTISATVTAVGFLRSGEKTSTKEWPSSLEIKGRVRLDAFEKFIQDLRMSRSRAVMISQFVLKEGSSEDDRASLCEVVDSYILDERLGFAEPAPGTEIYFCPYHTKILEILGNNLPKNYTETLKSNDSGLIGVIVWRKSHISSTISPNSSSHHKKQHFSSFRKHHQERDTNVNVNVNAASKQSILGKPPNHLKPQIDDDDDDDIPPGFGPPAAREDDDLPEFNFSNPLAAQKFPARNQVSNSNITPPSHGPVHSVDHVRNLINKYGNNENNVNSRNFVGGKKRWNNDDDDDDDDDDMPEWNPEVPQPPHRNSFQQPLLPTQAVNHQHAILQTGYAQPPVMPIMPLQRPTNNAMHGGFWPQQSAPQSNLGSQPSGGGGQYQGMPLFHHDAPRSRGF